MHIIRHAQELRSQVRSWRERRELIGFVPTMGNLHGGHIALVDEARKRCDRVVVSIFVNPTQFSPGEDYEAYPRTFDADCQWLAQHETDVVFAPGLAEVYPDGPRLRTRVEVPELNDILCGAYRPGHFTGVATVVTKLLNIVQPDLAVFGRKDYQQLMVIRMLVRDLSLPVQIVGGEIMREADGLAMSSRNQYLTVAERSRAPALFRVLCELAERLHGERGDPAPLEAEGLAALRSAGFEPDYVDIRRAEDLARPAPSDRELVVLGAGRLGRARILDNVPVSLPAPGLDF